MDALQRKSLSGLWLVNLENGARGIILNGVAVTGCRDQDGAPAVTQAGENLATALGLMLCSVSWKTPSLMQWEWSDIAEDMARCVTLTESQRRDVTVIHTWLSGGEAIHFTGHDLLSGANKDLWFPVPEDADLFEWVEHIMVMNHQAENVTCMEPRIHGGSYTDYQVRYNAHCPGLKQA